MDVLLRTVALHATSFRFNFTTICTKFEREARASTAAYIRKGKFETFNGVDP
jgi:hypothetical protein